MGEGRVDVALPQVGRLHHVEVAVGDDVLLERFGSCHRVTHSSPRTSAADLERLVGGRDAGVDGGLHQHLDELLLVEIPTFSGAGEVGPQLLGAAEGGELGDGDQAAVADGAARAATRSSRRRVSAT